MIKIALFASGNGTNVQRISEYFSGSERIHPELILCNNPKAYVLERAKLLEIPSVVFTRDEFYHTDRILNILRDHDISYIILAGFLWMIPDNLLKEYSGHIINIHPALLPKYGGKGMFGMKVHESVIASGDAESGITIHHVNEKYDEGEIIFQAKCRVETGDTPEMLAAKVHQLEYEYFPAVIEKYIVDAGC